MAYPINNNIDIWDSSAVLTGGTSNLTWTDTASDWSIPGPTTKEILDKLDISDIETYLRNKKIDRIKKGIN